MALPQPSPWPPKHCLTPPPPPPTPSDANDYGGDYDDNAIYLGPRTGALLLRFFAFVNAVGYCIQSHILHIPDRYGHFYAPQAPRNLRELKGWHTVAAAACTLLAVLVYLMIDGVVCPLYQTARDSRCGLSHFHILFLMAVGR